MVEQRDQCGTVEEGSLKYYGLANAKLIGYVLRFLVKRL